MYLIGSSTEKNVEVIPVINDIFYLELREREMFCV